MLIIREEAQWVVVWALKCEELGLDDPPVYLTEYNYGRMNRERIRENASTSEFLLQSVISEGILSSLHCASASCQAGILARVEERFVDLGLPLWHWPSDRTRHFGGADSIIELHDESWIFVGSLSMVGLQECLGLLPDWEYILE
jgi:hypothetical protein